jgi:hypothetical protein
MKKGTNIKYQFHFEDGQFMDVKDDEIEYPVLKTIGASKGIDEFFKQNRKNDYMRLFYFKKEELGFGWTRFQKYAYSAPQLLYNGKDVAPAVPYNISLFPIHSDIKNYYILTDKRSGYLIGIIDI